MINMLKSRSPYELTAIAAVGFAGIIHLLLAPVHWAHAPAHGLFFAISGVIEILWSFVALWNPSRIVLQGGTLLTGSLIFLWGITRSFPVPFGPDPEPVDVGGIICKVGEAVGLVTVLIVLFRQAVDKLGSAIARRSIGLLLVAALALGTMTYVAGRAMEPLFPSLAPVEETHPDEH